MSTKSSRRKDWVWLQIVLWALALSSLTFGQEVRIIEESQEPTSGVTDCDFIRHGRTNWVTRTQSRKYYCNESTGKWVLLTGGPDAVEEDDVQVGQYGTLNFEGTGVSCADDSTKVTCTITAGGSPAGDDTEVQFKDSTVFGGADDLLYNKTTGKTSVTKLAVKEKPWLDITHPAFSGGANCNGTADVGPALRAARNYAATLTAAGRNAPAIFIPQSQYGCACTTTETVNGVTTCVNLNSAEIPISLVGAGAKSYLIGKTDMDALVYVDGVSGAAYRPSSGTIRDLTLTSAYEGNCGYDTGTTCNSDADCNKRCSESIATTCTTDSNCPNYAGGETCDVQSCVNRVAMADVGVWLRKAKGWRLDNLYFQNFDVAFMRFGSDADAPTGAYSYAHRTTNVFAQAENISNYPTYGIEMQDGATDDLFVNVELGGTENTSLLAKAGSAGNFFQNFHPWSQDQCEDNPRETCQLDSECKRCSTTTWKLCSVNGDCPTSETCVSDTCIRRPTGCVDMTSGGKRNYFSGMYCDTPKDFAFKIGVDYAQIDGLDVFMPDQGGDGFTAVQLLTGAENNTINSIKFSGTTPTDAVVWTEVETGKNSVTNAWDAAFVDLTTTPTDQISRRTRISGNEEDIKLVLGNGSDDNNVILRFEADATAASDVSRLSFWNAAANIAMIAANTTSNLDDGRIQFHTKETSPGTLELAGTIWADGAWTIGPADKNALHALNGTVEVRGDTSATLRWNEGGTNLWTLQTPSTGTDLQLYDNVNGKQSMRVVPGVAEQKVIFGNTDATTGTTLQLRSDSLGSTTLAYGDDGGDLMGSIEYDHFTDDLNFYTYDGVSLAYKRMWLDENGVTLGRNSAEDVVLRWAQGGTYPNLWWDQSASQFRLDNHALHLGDDLHVEGGDTYLDSTGTAYVYFQNAGVTGWRLLGTEAGSFGLQRYSGGAFAERVLNADSAGDLTLGDGTNQNPQFKIEGHLEGSNGEIGRINFLNEITGTPTSVVRLMAQRYGADNSGRFDIEVADAGAYDKLLTLWADGGVGLGATDYTGYVSVRQNLYINTSGTDTSAKLLFQEEGTTEFILQTVGPDTTNDLQLYHPSSGEQVFRADNATRLFTVSQGLDVDGGLTVDGGTDLSTGTTTLGVTTLSGAISMDLNGGNTIDLDATTGAAFRVRDSSNNPIFEILGTGKVSSLVDNIWIGNASGTDICLFFNEAGSPSREFCWNETVNAFEFDAGFYLNEVGGFQIYQSPTHTDPSIYLQGNASSTEYLFSAADSTAGTNFAINKSGYVTTSGLADNQLYLEIAALNDKFRINGSASQASPLTQWTTGTLSTFTVRAEMAGDGQLYYGSEGGGTKYLHSGLTTGTSLPAADCNNPNWFFRRTGAGQPTCIYVSAMDSANTCNWELVHCTD